MRCTARLTANLNCISYLQVVRHQLEITVSVINLLQLASQSELGALHSQIIL